MFGGEEDGGEYWMQQRIADEVGCAAQCFGAVPQLCVHCQYSDGDISRLSSEGRNSGTKAGKTAGMGVQDSRSAWGMFIKRAEIRGSLFLSSRRCRRIKMPHLHNRGPWFELVEAVIGLLFKPRRWLGARTWE